MAYLESMNARFERLVMLALALSAGAGPQPERAIDMHQALVFLGSLDRLGVRLATTGVDIARLQAGDRWPVTHDVVSTPLTTTATTPVSRQEQECHHHNGNGHGIAVWWAARAPAAI